MLSVLLDAPTPGAKTYTVARLGQFKDRRYGSFEIGRTDFDEWSRKLTGVFGGEVAIDTDHAADRGQSSRAAGWIKGLELATDEHGERVDAKIEWTPYGERLLRDREYRFFSPTFVDALKDEQGKNIGKALIGGALTNRPFLRRGMKPLTLDSGTFEAEDGDPRELDLSSEYLDEVLTLLDADSVGPAARSKLSGLIKHYMSKPHPFTSCVTDNRKRFGERAEAVCATLKDIGAGTTKWRNGGDKKSLDEVLEPATIDGLRTLGAILESEESRLLDSQGVSDFVKILSKSLGLEEDASEEQIAEAVAKLGEREPVTLDASNLPDGMVLLTADKAAELEAGATAGADAMKALTESRWNTAYESALARGAIDAKDETKELHRGIFDGDPDTSVKLLTSLPDNGAFPAGARGEGSGGPAPSGSAPGHEEVTHAGEGRVEMDEDRADLALKALTAAREKGELTMESFEAEIDKLTDQGVL